MYKFISSLVFGNEIVKLLVIVGIKLIIINLVVFMVNVLRVNVSNVIGIIYFLFNFESVVIVVKIKFVKNSSSYKIFLLKMKR